MYYQTHELADQAQGFDAVFKITLVLSLCNMGGGNTLGMAVEEP